MFNTLKTKDSKLSYDIGNKRTKQKMKISFNPNNIIIKKGKHKNTAS